MRTRHFPRRQLRSRPRGSASCSTSSRCAAGFRGPAELRILPNTGSTLVALEVTTKREGSERADSVPVVWHDAPAAAQSLDAGDEVVVVGHVARRFFRAGGATQSRTEVVASSVIPVRSAKRVEAALREAASVLDGALPVRSSK